MTAIVCGWNPELWNSWDYETVVGHVRESGRILERWSVGRHRDIAPRAEAWLLLQGQSRYGRGLIGHGIVTSEVFETEHYSDPARTLRYVDIEWDALLPLGSQIPSAVLADAVPRVRWDSFRESGRTLPAESEPELRRLWQEYGPRQDGDPVFLIPGTYPEGAVTRVEVNRYERSPEARRRCLAFHGTSCAACGFSFQEHYGEVAKDFVHVHHIVPVSRLGPGYQLDPEADLVPLCANCHNVAHLGVSVPRSVAEIRAMIAGAGYLPGRLVSSEKLQAQDDAKRILGQ